MKHDRPGDWLWLEWDGDEYEPQDANAVVYVTYGEMDMDDDLVRRALASALQRDGVAQSLGHGFRMVDIATVSRGHAGTVGSSRHPSVCDEFGLTHLGDPVDSKVVATWVEIVAE
jgi:hypothetical protein